ncbi:MAG TPA: hypothetical protein V6C71_08430 [Coleofasciculaceae cyanobacterium]
MHNRTLWLPLPRLGRSVNPCSRSDRVARSEASALEHITLENKLVKNQSLFQRE